jgi:hypothetical protein
MPAALLVATSGTVRVEQNHRVPAECQLQRLEVDLQVKHWQGGVRMSFLLVVIAPVSLFSPAKKWPFLKRHESRKLSRWVC